MNKDQERPEGSEGLSSEEASRQTQQEAMQQEELQRCAADRVKRWPRILCVDDYDFRGWADGASKNCLRAGVVYEYARESRKLRCLLVLMNPNRPRSDWEIKLLPYHFHCFENLSERDAARALGDFVDCLAELADSLLENISFGELFRAKRDELEKAFGGLDKLARVRRADFYPVDAVTLASPAEAEQITVCEATVSQPYEGDPSQRRREICSDGSEIVTLRISWRGHTDNELGAAMERFARTNRPKQDICNAPQRKGRGRKDILLSALDNLSAMRLVRRCPIGEAVDLFGGVRLNARGGALEQRKIRDQKAEAEIDFGRDFPFGEHPANYGTFVEAL